MCNIVGMQKPKSTKNIGHVATHNKLLHALFFINYSLQLPTSSPAMISDVTMHDQRQMRKEENEEDMGNWL